MITLHKQKSLILLFDTYIIVSKKYFMKNTKNNRIYNIQYKIIKIIILFNSNIIGYEYISHIYFLHLMYFFKYMFLITYL